MQITKHYLFLFFVGAFFISGFFPLITFAQTQIDGSPTQDNVLQTRPAPFGNEQRRMRPDHERRRAYDQNGDSRERRMRPNKANRPNLVQELQLTQEQKQKMQGLRQSHMQALQQRKDSIKQARDAFEQAIKGTKSDEELRSLYQKFEEAKTSMAKEQFEQILTIRSLLTD